MHVAQKALRDANGDASRVDWGKVDGTAAAEAIRDHGQSPADVAEMLRQRSPLMSDPANHQRLDNWLAKHADNLQAEYKQRRAERDSGLQLG